ncbi:MAG: acyl-CoA reductase [Candidatus Tyrphobacter sp.]
MQRRSTRASIVRAVADAAARWCNPAFSPRERARARVVERTGYSVPVVAYAFDRLFESIAAGALDETIARELGDAHFEPIGRVCVISSRTTIGVAIVPAIFALCAGCDVTVKDREDSLVGAFFETLAGESEILASAAQATAWNGEREEHDLAAYDAVVAFGSDDALRAIRARLRPDARFIAYGPRASIGYVTREALASEDVASNTARGAARDFVLYDGEGCLSLHALFVERDGRLSPEGFLELLAGAVEGTSIDFPLGARAAGTIASVASARDLGRFRGGPVHSDAEATFVLEIGGPERAPAFLPRVLAVHGVRDPVEMRAYVARHRLPLEACAVAGERYDVRAAAIAAGANRIARFGELQAPPLSYAHGGRPRVSEFVRIITEGTP